MDKAMKDALIDRAARAAMERCDAALRWDSIGEPERQGWKRQAEAALEATGVFDLVEAARRVDACEDPEADETAQAFDDLRKRLVALDALTKTEG